MNTPTLPSSPLPDEGVIAQRDHRARGLRRCRRELRLWITVSGAALAFDAFVFLLLGLLALSVPLVWLWPWPGEAWMVLGAAVLFGLLWTTMSAPDWRRYRKLRRRWIDQPDLPPTPWRVSTLTPRRPSAPPPVRSRYRPVRGSTAASTRWAWRGSRY